MRDPLRPALGVRVSNSVGQRRVPISRARRHMRTAFAQIMKAHPRTDDQHALITKRRQRTSGTDMIRWVKVAAKRKLSQRNVRIGQRDFHWNEHTVVPSRSEEHTSDLQSLMPNPHAVFCMKKNKKQTK